MENLLFLGVTILKHIRVIPSSKNPEVHTTLGIAKLSQLGCLDNADSLLVTFQEQNADDKILDD